MASKTVNQNREIATLTSLHKAITTPEATCHYTDGGAYTNFITSNECATEEAAQRTKIRDAQVITTKSRIGAPHHATTSRYVEKTLVLAKGAKSGQLPHTFAKAEDGSPNCKIENAPAVRTDDPTQQAWDNSKGFMREKGFGLNKNDLLAMLRQQCTLSVVTTTCKHKREVDLLRASRLEVFYGDTVTLVATRINATAIDAEARKIPKCLLESGLVKRDPAEEKHARWEISRGAYPARVFRSEPLTQLKKSEFGDTLKLGEEWLGKEASERTKDGDNTGKTSFEGRGREKIAGDPTLSEIQNGTARQGKRQAAMGKVFQDGWNGARSLLSIADIINYLSEPAIEVKVTAIACAGPRTITVAAYPPDKFVCKLLDLVEVKRKLERIGNAIHTIGRWLAPIKGAAEMIPGCPKVQITGIFLGMAIEYPREHDHVEAETGTFLNLYGQWRELNRDYAKGFKQQVHLAGGLEVGFEKLLGFTFELDVPLAACTGPLGAFASWLLTKIHVGVYVIFEISLSCGLEGNMGWDEYGSFSGETSIKGKGDGKLGVGLKADAGFASLQGELRGNWRPELKVQYDEEHIIKMELESKYTIDIVFRVGVDVLGFKVDHEFDPIQIYPEKGQSLSTGKPEEFFPLDVKKEGGKHE